MKSAEFWRNERTCFVFMTEEELDLIRRIQADALKWCEAEFGRAPTEYEALKRLNDRIKELEQ